MNDLFNTLLPMMFYSLFFTELHSMPHIAAIALPSIMSYSNSERFDKLFQFLRFLSRAAISLKPCTGTALTLIKAKLIKVNEAGKV